MFLIVGCYDWVGYHITNKLLEQGQEVIGIDTMDSDKKENLAMFVGRNGLFSHYDSAQAVIKDKKHKEGFKAIIFIKPEDISDIEEISYFSQVSLCLRSKNENMDECVTFVDIPLLYGEWMPRDNEGIFHGEEYVRFDSDQFKKEATYIEDFVNAFIKFAEESESPDYAMFASDKSEKEDENITIVRETKSQGERLQELDEHYEKFHFLY
ncbi:NAD(P)-dependent oxidoreductase [Aquibacillus kalidii]|uniref:NAD(P)-dependent oxidoreductase n=1 Tax=Aquibacillus kalidii TaxID=2762597 RepID=UPI001647B873|nr:NAD(P)-dependent oxidoreductase [Aquibacillus kalidii]